MDKTVCCRDRDTVAGPVKFGATVPSFSGTRDGPSLYLL